MLRFDTWMPVPVIVNVPLILGFIPLSPRPTMKVLFVAIVGDSEYPFPG
jgi:hypothetical protein